MYCYINDKFDDSNDFLEIYNVCGYITTIHSHDRRRNQSNCC